MSFFESILSKIGNMFSDFVNVGRELLNLPEGYGLLYTAIARWVFIFLAIFILAKSIFSLLASRSPNEVWAYFNIDDKISHPITHWENLIGRSKSCDLIIKDGAASRSHGTLSRDAEGNWSYMDLGSSNGSICGGEKLKKGEKCYIEPGDSIVIGKSRCTLFPISLEERRNNQRLRKEETFLLSPWTSLLLLTLFQLMTVIQLNVSLGEYFTRQIPISFAGLCCMMWIYVIVMRSLKRKSFEMETIAFFLSTLSLAVTASKFPGAVFKQFVAIGFGLALFIAMCTVLRNIDRSKAIRKYLYFAAAGMLVFNLLLGTTKFGAANWVSVGGLSVQPSEIVKLAFIWVGAASLDELMEKRNSIIFMIFSGFCFVCLALMGDFGTALIFFVSFLVISFLRSGDFTKLILIVGVAFVGGLMVLKFKSYVAARFAAWGHVWEFADEMGYQQTRTMSAASSGGLIGVGAGDGWLKHIPASETDLVFGFITEEWGLIIAVLAICSIVTLSLFAVRSIWGGRSTFYTIAACSAMSLFLFQTMLNVFGSVDLFPLTGVTFPFLSNGGTSMVASWGLLAFLKASDTRQSASIAVSNEEALV
ncbi:MAG: FtsW/RodA/SpoVE family cell cycle protein [Eubacterium sp.]|nr:FtsW/RodA/SpoVE family cell cycle protein [Eubacterium sp.]